MKRRTPQEVMEAVRAKKLAIERAEREAQNENPDTPLASSSSSASKKSQKTNRDLQSENPKPSTSSSSASKESQKTNRDLQSENPKPSTSTSDPDNQIEEFSDESDDAENDLSQNPAPAPSREINRTSNVPEDLLLSRAVPPPNLFPRSTLIHTSDSFKIYDRQTPFKRQKSFDSSDRLYGINVQMSDGQEGPFMTDCQDVMRSVLEYVIGQIQHAFDKNRHRQIYVTISDINNMLNGINTANYSIREDKDVIIKEALSQFFIFLQSHKEMHLTDSFKIHVKVLGIEHVHHRMTKLNNLRLHLPSEDSPEHPQNIPNGAARMQYCPDPNSIQKWKFSPPAGFSKHKFLSLIHI